MMQTRGEQRSGDGGGWPRVSSQQRPTTLVRSFVRELCRETWEGDRFGRRGIPSVRETDQTGRTDGGRSDGLQRRVCGGPTRRNGSVCGTSHRGAPSRSEWNSKTPTDSTYNHIQSPQSQTNGFVTQAAAGVPVTTKPTLRHETVPPEPWIADRPNEGRTGSLALTLVVMQGPGE